MVLRGDLAQGSTLEDTGVGQSRDPVVLTAAEAVESREQGRRLGGRLVVLSKCEIGATGGLLLEEPPSQPAAKRGEQVRRGVGSRD